LGQILKKIKKILFFKPKLGRIWQKSKKSRYKWIFGDRKSFIPKKISKMFEFKAKTGAKMTKKKQDLGEN